MSEQLEMRTHPRVNEIVRALPQCLRQSFEIFQQRLKGSGDLSDFIHTQPFSPKDAVGNRTLIAHYHLRPCLPSCYLVWVMWTRDTVYILDVAKHPPQNEFASSEIEERIYPRLDDLCSELVEYRLPGTFRSGLPVRKKDMFGAKAVKGTPTVVPVRASGSNYLPLGQLGGLRNGQTRVGIIVGTVEIPQEEIPDEAIECFDYDDHPERESLTLYISGWRLHSGIYRKETEHLLLCFCSLHKVFVGMSNRRPPRVVALPEQIYLALLERLKTKFPSVDGNEQELGELVDWLTDQFPLHRN